MNHPIEVPGHPDIKQLAELLGNLRYDVLRDLIGELADKILSDHYKDHSAKRFKLAEELYSAQLHLLLASNAIHLAWVISEPYMKNEHTSNSGST